MPLDRKYLREEMDPETGGPTYKVRLAATMFIASLICAVMVFAAYSQGWVRYIASLGDLLHWL